MIFDITYLLFSMSDRFFAMHQKKFIFEGRLIIDVS